MPEVTAPVTAGSDEATVAVIPSKRTMVRVEQTDLDPGCLAFPVNYEDLRNLKGRLLTLTDATFTDPQQRKAQKDCIWQVLQAWMSDVEHDCGYGGTIGPTVSADELPW
jgi:hypothetical protein